MYHIRIHTHIHIYSNANPGELLITEAMMAEYSVDVTDGASAQACDMSDQ